MKPKVGSLKKINKIVKLLAIWTKEKIEIQMTKKKKKDYYQFYRGKKGL